MLKKFTFVFGSLLMLYTLLAKGEVNGACADLAGHSMELLSENQAAPIRYLNASLEKSYLIDEGVYIPAPELTSCLRRRDQQHAIQLSLAIAASVTQIHWSFVSQLLVYYSGILDFSKQIFEYLFLLTPF